MAENRSSDGSGEDRREFIDKVSKGAMAAGLVGGYGGLGAIAVRYLYPARPEELTWQYVAEVDAIPVGDCKAPRSLMSATREGYDIAKAL